MLDATTQGIAPVLYLASPLFSAAELQFNAALKKQLSPHLNVFLPQEDGGLLVDLVKSGIDPVSATTHIFRIDIEAIRKCDALLIVLDGRTVDEGACFELGFAYAIGKPCFGIQTDVRRMLETGNNPMIDVALRQKFRGLDELLSWARDFGRSGQKGKSSEQTNLVAKASIR